jgi:hypothetical protein
MARITLNIEAADSTDLADTISSLMYLSAYKTEPPIESATEEPEAAATQDAGPGERQRRPRRTRAQIAADEETASKQNGIESKSGETAGGTTSTGDADPFSEPLPPTSSGSPASLSVADVKKAMSAYLDKDGHDASGMKAILRAFKDKDTGEMLLSVGQMRPEDYAGAIEKLAV